MDVISCVSLGWCLSLFSSLPTLYEKGVQVVWGASYERPGVCFVFSGDLGVWEGEGEVHTPCVNGCHFSGVSFSGALFLFVPYHDI